MSKSPKQRRHLAEVTSHPLLGHISKTAPSIATTAATAVGVRVALYANSAVAAETAGHADSFAYEAGGIAGGSLGGDTEHALNGWWDTEAEAGKKSSQSSARDEGHDNDEEDLPWVALSPVDEVAEEAFELLVCLLDKALTWGALVVRRATVSKEAGAAVVTAKPKE